MTGPPTFPHCDQRVLHAPGECQYCDMCPEWQQLRVAWGIAFTGHAPRGILPQCGKVITVAWGRATDCKQPDGHEGSCEPYPARDILPCPADFARPADSPADHRRWPGNRPK